VTNLIVWLILGRLAIWLIQINGFTRHWMKPGGLLRELVDCDLCLGVWVFAGLAGLLRINMLETFYVPILSEMLSGAMASFAVHLAVLGWQVKFGATDLG
jgi:hypothetical protein